MLTKRIKWLYSMGDMSVAMPLAIVAFYQLIFLTDVAGLRPDLAGLAVGIGRLWDAFNDPIFGIVSDRIQSKHGRRRVLLRYATIPAALAFILLFIVPPLGQTGLVVYYALAIILFDSLFTTINVSYNALTPAITQDYDQQSTLNGYRMSYSIFGSLFSVILATILGSIIDDPRTLYRTLGIIIGVLTAIPMLIAYAVTGAYDSESAEDQMSASDAMRATLSNRPFLLLMGLYLFSWTTASLTASVLIFFVNYYMGIPGQANYVILVAQTSAILFIPLWVVIARRTDKRRAFIWGSITWAINLTLLALIRPEQVALAYLLAALSGAGIAVAYFLPWSMIPDVIEYDRAITGIRREGAYYAFAAFFQKLGTGIVIWGFGIALASYGYITPDPTAATLPTQPPAAVTAIRLSMALVPAVLLLLAIICAYFYPLSRKEHAAITVP